MPHRSRTGINIFPAEYVATLSADTPGTLCDLQLLLLTGCGNAMWARQSFTGLHIWNMRTTCAGYSTGRPAICESFNVRGFGGRTLDSSTFYVSRFTIYGSWETMRERGMGQGAPRRIGVRRMRKAIISACSHMKRQAFAKNRLCTHPSISPFLTNSTLFHRSRFSRSTTSVPLFSGSATEGNSTPGPLRIFSVGAVTS